MKKKYFEKVDPKADFPKMEDALVSYWKENKIFEKSLDKNPKTKKWTFLDGPPFITGLPHYGTLLSSIPKDIFPRFWTMKGYNVRRVWGWDCHGLPAENKVENKLGIQRKKDIEDKVGIDKFISECKKYVGEVSDEWEWYVEHLGRWVDFKNAYKTMDKDYMESVMWVFKNMYDKGYIYKGLRVSLFCPHCSTPISNFEVAMDPDNYKDITEVSNTYKYKLKNKNATKPKTDTFLLAWSTTPWTKLTTTALAVNPKLKYVKVKIGNDLYILAENTAERVLKNRKYKILEKFIGKRLLGLEFEAHYDFFEKEKGKKSFVVIDGDFVTDSDGTGIVTIAPYGEDDLKVMLRDNIQVVLNLDEEGKFSPQTPNWAGLYYEDANPLINEDLKKRGLLFDEQPITHSVATCWRCHTRLIYAPQDAWYVDIQSLKKRLFKNNEKVNWFPKHFKYGRFKKSMEAAPDWCISRSRYWGSPVPVWECSCGERFVPGSIKELEKRFGRKINDLHKPLIDEIKIKCDKCGKEVSRVPEVLDSWIEAGSASFAERHFPFKKDVDLEDFFPPDFIVEYTGQIRAWFYVLHVISTALYDSNAFKNVLVTGVILGTDGRKMSKNFGNYPDPREMLTTYGADALRLYLTSTPVMKGEDVAISEDNYRDWVKNYLLVLWNIYNYFVTYANLNDWTPEVSKTKKNETKNVLDKWIVLRLNELIVESTVCLEKYDTIGYVSLLKDFISDFSTWYIRRSRDREDKKDFFGTTYFVLTNLCKVSAPMTPFISDLIYRNLTKEESVHLSSWPKVKVKSSKDIGILSEMKTVREIVEKGHSLRKNSNIPVRQPLSEFKIKNSKLNTAGLEQLVLDELNIKSVRYSQKSYSLNTNITPKLAEEAKARELIRKIQNERKRMGVDLDDKIEVVSDWLPEDESLLNWILKKTLSSELSKGEFSVKKI